MIGRWNGPVAATTKRASMVPSDVSTQKPGRPVFLRTEVTSTPVRIGASIFSAYADEVIRDLFLRGEPVGVDVELLTGKSVVPGGAVRDQGIPPP